MARHVALAARLLRLWAAFNFIVGFALLAFGVSAAMLAGAPDTAPGTEVAAGVTAATLFVVAISALAWAAAHRLAAGGLDAGRRWARHLSLVLAAFNLLLLPLGTALGAYMLWVLLHEDVRVRFERAAPGPSA